MSAGRNGVNRDTELDRLKRQYPRWRIWRGRVTGEYWAMPPAGHPALRELISADAIGELADRIARAEGRPDG